ncbi:serine/threonine-protein kinase [Kitasatospora sp. NPDC048540]|uniref:serine/threonine-protein kinase n=1 Tax=Kitasatospora sp. NPDC048540 TaxID=3155634 RepID=UPI0033FD7444
MDEAIGATGPADAQHDEPQRPDGTEPKDGTAPQDGTEPQAGPDQQWELPDYEHLRELGAGAAGRVVLAHHRATGTPVAVKYLSGSSADHRGFRAEAELLGGLRSPYIAQLYEYVESPQGAAIVMELVDGISLRDLLRAEGATAPEAALTVLKGSLLGLAAAHGAGVIHRDYKPANVLVAADGSSKLVDFGIAVRSGATGAIAGTPAYMAPEQWAGEPAAPATDVYAATATFFECLTGAKPYAGTTLMELAVQHTEAQIPAEQAPEALRPLIRAGLAKTPQERPDGAALLVEQLEEVAGAAYGEDWEERGRRQLAALVALLPLLLPFGGVQAGGGTSFASTTLAPPGPGGPAGPNAAGVARFGRRAKLASAATGVVLVAGAMAGVAVAGAQGAAGTTDVAAPRATTTLGAATPTGDPGPVTPASAPPSDSASPSASTSASASASASPSATLAAPPSPGSPATPKVTPTPSVTKPTTAPPVTVTPPPPTSATPTVTVAPLQVYSSTMKASCSGLYAARADGTVSTNGTGPGTVTVTWTDANGKVVGTQSTPLPAGKTTVAFSSTQSFGTASTLTARVATSPAAPRGKGAAPATLYSFNCNPPR